MVIRGWGVGAGAGSCVTSGKATGVATYGGGAAGTLAASGGVVGLVLWSNVGGITCSSSSTGRSSGSLRVGDGKPSSKKIMSGLDDHLSFRVPNPVTASFVLVTHEETHSRSLINLLQPFFRLNNGARRSESAQM